ncbi:MAG: urease accessory protein UreE [Muribaculaceae bacterium]|nr:urease accessory protein UreE [Muribaculaceae bacterium]MDE5713711.1 urease accessory protein UreE [Muribaculaceae bacterium]
MKIYTTIIGNMNHSDEWKDKLKSADIDYVFLDQWTAQKSRFLGKGVSGVEYPIALARHSQIVDGDIIEFDTESNKAVVLRIELSPVLVIDMGGLVGMDPQAIIRISVELGHAIGNQHWPAVVKETKVYVPLTVDKKVMESVMETHHIEGISYEFQKGLDIIPYLAPHEIRRLFGGAEHESHSHEHSHIVHYHSPEDEEHCGCKRHHHDGNIKGQHHHHHHDHDDDREGECVKHHHEKRKNFGHHHECEELNEKHRNNGDGCNSK